MKLFISRCSRLLFVLILAHHTYAQDNTVLDYSQQHFDSDTCCWRRLSKEQKFSEAASMIVDYLDRGPVSNRHALNWHAGQLFAAAGNNKKSRALYA